jgi:DNA invertase Pin-like site-specific DNA recombinase
MGLLRAAAASPMPTPTTMTNWQNQAGAVAQFERDLIIERTRAGLAMARKNGKRLGPPVKWQPDMAKQARRLLDKGESHGSGSCQRAEGVEAHTLFRSARRSRARRAFRGLKHATR